MTSREPNPFISITSVGGLLPIPILERIATEIETLPGGRAEDYELLPGKRLREIINRSWNDLLGAWSAFKGHLGSLPQGELAVGITREKWLLPLLRELGWSGLEARGSITIEDAAGTATTSWPITHEWREHVPLHLLGANVNIDSRSPGVPGAASAAPHSIVQEFLNSTSSHLWGVVANGRVLRLLRDSTSLTRQAFVEFDLETMFENEVFADFTVLWLTCHRTRFESDLPENCWLERWQNESHEQGVRALDDLSGGVQRALEALGTGLIRHPANQKLRSALHEGELSSQDFYRQLLRIAYRLVFLFVVEDRELLHDAKALPDEVERYRTHYSTARLRELARMHAGGHHSDSWEQVTVLFNRLGAESGIPQLGLPSLAGGLFDLEWTSHLTETRVANKDLFAAIRSLAYTQRESVLHRVDYRHLGSEELGSIYESLLELHPTIDLGVRAFSLGTAAGNERKSTGAYYTPTSLISQLLDDALEPVADDAMARSNEDTAEQAILDLTVCDPACGSAHFLVAAAHRLAKRLAGIRTGDPEPAPLAVQQALRDVVSRCIYGVDMNPMAVELAKVSLWLECHVPGQPLTFLDHHIRCGNSLLGVHHPDLMTWNPIAPEGERGGIPDEAFAVLHGDDNSAVSVAKRSNRERRDGTGLQKAFNFDDMSPVEDLGAAERTASALREMRDDTLDALRAKRQVWEELDQDEMLKRSRLAADAWCATFTIAKTNVSVESRVQHPWDVYYAAMGGHGLPPNSEGVRLVREEAQRQNFFHWFCEFPEIQASSGFDLMLGNPPWERLKIQEKEWFAARAPDVAIASNKAARNRMIKALYEAPEGSPDLALAREWDDAQQTAAAQSHLIRRSGLFPLGGVGDLNVYAAFADLFRQLIRTVGRAGLICPTGLAVGATYADFFSHLVRTGRLVSFYSFENEDKVFPEVHNETKFALVTIAGSEHQVREIAFTGYVRQAAEIHDSDRRYTLKPADIEAINPNSLTAPLFRHRRDADVTATIHRNVPVLVREGVDGGDPWDFDYMRMFDMANDSHLFVTYDEAVARGGSLAGATFVLSETRCLRPLYEGKMIWHYDHRYGTYEGQTAKQANKGVLPHVTDPQHADPSFSILHRYWVPERLVEEALEQRWRRAWMISFRDVGPSERTMVCAVLPAVAANNKTPLIFTDASPRQSAFLYASLAALPVDYSLRQKTSGGMNLFVIKQAPIQRPPGESVVCPWGEGALLDFVTARVVELSYTAHDLADFAEDCAMPGAPFRWDPDRRAVLQAELDALFFHLYGLDRSDTEWVLDTFTVLRKYEVRPPPRGGHGEFRTKRLVLERYDDMAKAITDQQPYETPLVAPPGDDSVRHRVPRS